MEIIPQASPQHQVFENIPLRTVESVSTTTTPLTGTTIVRDYRRLIPFIILRRHLHVRSLLTALGSSVQSGKYNETRFHIIYTRKILLYIVKRHLVCLRFPQKGDLYI